MNPQSPTETSDARELSAELQDLLYREAWLLDHGCLDEWLELIAQDIHYWAPVRLDRARGNDDFQRSSQMAHLDEDYQGLVYRVRRIQSGATFTDEPPARVRHFISNVRLIARHDELHEVTSNFMVFHSHVGTRDYTLVGSRDDKWRRNGASWKLHQRLIIFDQMTMPGLSVLL